MEAIQVNQENQSLDEQQLKWTNQNLMLFSLTVKSAGNVCPDNVWILLLIGQENGAWFLLSNYITLSRSRGWSTENFGYECKSGWNLESDSAYRT